MSRTDSPPPRMRRLLLLAPAAVGLVLLSLWALSTAPGPVREQAEFEITFPDPMVWVPVADSASTEGAPGAVDELTQQLNAIGYLRGYSEASTRSGVTRFESEQSSAGQNLLVSAHAPGAELLDMAGQVVHRWHFSYRDALPERFDAKKPRQSYWRRVFPFDNGEVLAIFEGEGLIKIDRDSRLLWAAGGSFHHDVDVGPDGTIYALTRPVRIIPRLHPKLPYLEDSIAILSAEGRIRREISILEAFERSPFADVLDELQPWGDGFHTNTIAVLGGSGAGGSPAFRSGNLLISLRELHVLAIVDPDTDSVVWALRGAWRGQHEPVLLESGRLLLFDNEGNAGSSRVIEIDPVTGDLLWSWGGSDERHLRSECCGTAQRLPNGNTLVTESTAGRAVEITPTGEIVWEYLSPHRSGEKGELVAVIFDLIRLPAEFGSEWLK